MRRTIRNIACGLCLVCSACGGGESGTASVGVGSTDDTSATNDSTVSNTTASTSSTQSATDSTSSSTSTTTGSTTSTTAGTETSTTGAGGAGVTGTTEGTGGTGGTGGSAGTTTSGGGNGPLECNDATGEPGSCEVTEDSSCCTRCIATLCCAEYADCFAQDPANVCGGGADSDSEAFAFLDCMLAIEDGAIPSDVETCAGEATTNVSGPLCGAGSISPMTNDFIACMVGDQDGLGGCFNECLRNDFEEGSCSF